MKRIIKEIIGYILIQLNHFRIKRKSAVLSVYFHDPPKILFDKIISWLHKKGYKFISIDELYSMIDQKEKINNTVFMSFDDGWKNNLKLIESINLNKIPITIFIPTEAVEQGNYWWEYAEIEGQEKFSDIKKLENFKKLSDEVFRKKINLLKDQYTLERSCVSLEELKKMDENELITIGSHTVTHPILNKCTVESQEFEIIESKQILQKWLNKSIDYLAFPNGDYDNKTIDIAIKSGYKLCFSTRPGFINTATVNPFIIPRNSVNDEGGFYENISKILGIWQKFYFR